MSLCQRCDPAGHIHGPEIQFLESIRKRLSDEAVGHMKNISLMLTGEIPLNRFTADSLKECLYGISAIDNILLVVK